VGSKAVEYVATLEPSRAGRWDSELWATWQCVDAGLPGLQGTDRGPWAHLRGGCEPTGGAKFLAP
jgi:hypothetical protein